MDGVHIKQHLVVYSTKRFGLHFPCKCCSSMKMQPLPKQETSRRMDGSEREKCLEGAGSPRREGADETVDFQGSQRQDVK